MPPIGGAAPSALPDILTAFSETSSTCSPEGEMLWEKTSDGRDIYSLCYAPSLREGSLGPTGGHQQCDAGSYFTVEAPRFCCRRPRIDIAGHQEQAKGQVCGDLMAEFEQEGQRLRVVRGPTSSASQQQLAELSTSGLGSAAPSPLAFHAMKDVGKWRQVGHRRCGGRSGTLIAWRHSDPPGRAELCPTGTAPVHGYGFASWACDGVYTQERYIHCCKVKGHLHCVNNLGEHRAWSQCNCKGPRGGQETGDAPVASSVCPLLPALLTGERTPAGPEALPCASWSIRLCRGRRFL
mmetsp:Transcript_45020/g.90884  ORF Transcript_45020/g.90884 Transcript_45020/m.90884 type:complete len:294 (+) Transcript_45020:142-1023(+)